MPKKNQDKKSFSAWLQEMGAIVLAPTSQWEFARFRAQGAVHVIYVNQKGLVNATGFALECLEAFNKKQRIAMGYTSGRHYVKGERVAAIMLRDGENCWFCEKPLGEDITIEHLVGKNKGGPDHTDNMVLAHDACNKAAGSKPLVEKIQIRLAALLAGVKTT